MWFFGRVKRLEQQVDLLLDNIEKSADIFCKGIKAYLENDKEAFLSFLEEADKLESAVDDLRRKVEEELYMNSLIPDHRGDVLGLLENLDNIIDTAKRTLRKFDVEIPEIPQKFHRDFNELAEKSKQAAVACVDASRAFFNSVFEVKSHLNKVYLFEKEADRISKELKRKIFLSDLKQSHKIHLRYFALSVETMSDKAEEVADRLAIYTIKREM